MGEQEHVLHSHGVRAVALSFCESWRLFPVDPCVGAICENWSELCKSFFLWLGGRTPNFVRFTT